jgi:hypothetical protein
MHCLNLADLAAILAHHGPSILYRRRQVPTDAVTRYWSACRQRFDLWHHAFGRYREIEQQGNAAHRRSWWETHHPLLEEILVSEMLTRVYAAVGAGLDSDADQAEISPVVHSVYLSQLEARNRVLHLMVYGRGNSIDEAVRLNRLRREVDRWTDVLIGQLTAAAPGSLDYAICRQRASGHASEANSHGSGNLGDTLRWLSAATMRDALARRLHATSALPEANRKVAEAVMLCLRPDLFDSVGLLKSLWIHRLEAGADQTDQVLSQLSASDLGEADKLKGFEAVRDPQLLRRLL